jgi:aminoglycoside phosphotransferase
VDPRLIAAGIAPGLGPLSPGAPRRGAQAVVTPWLDAGSIPRVWVKVHHSVGVARREAAFVGAFLASGPMRAWVPPLLHHEGATLVWGARPGVPWDQVAAGERAKAARALGEALRVLHASPWIDPDPVPLREAVGRRLEAWRQDEPGWVRRLLALRDEVAPATWRRVPAHRDVQGGNVLWDEASGVLTLLDFGQARPDLAHADLAKLGADVLDPSGPLRAPFFEAYGPTDPAAVALAVALHGLATRSWGRRHGDPGVEAAGDAILAAWGR